MDDVVQNGVADNVLLSMKTLDSQTTTNGTAPPAQTSRQKVKRRVVRKAFYSDEEDESSEEEVPPHYPITGGNLAGTLREQPILGGMGSTTKSFGFRDDVNADRSSGDGRNVGMNGTFFDGDEDDDLSEDHKLLLSSSLPLLKSRNSAVVLAVCSLHYYCGIASVKVSLF
jgi:AP-3 complex subunit beta